MMDTPIAPRIIRALREGVRESLTLASALGVSVARVNAELHALKDRCAGCLELVPPYLDEPRLVVTVRDWRALQRSVVDAMPTAKSASTRVRSSRTTGTVSRSNVGEVDTASSPG